jgi:hypothetical protein
LAYIWFEPFKKNAMKITVILSFTLAMALTGCSVSSSAYREGSPNSRGEKKAADFEKVATLIESGNFQFTVRNASPAGGRTIQITSEYTLEARKGEYEARLPYFGRAYSASYGGDGGIEFKGKPQDFQLARNERKSTLRASFTIDGESDQYQLRLEVGASGFGNLLVSSQKRQNISYYGQVSELEP